ncbi:ATP-binding protein [Anaerobium acetethylicum]|uniref:Sensor histidine kinase YesM n=1 Tax=Anaerobium acetethylicum TaxID=1619234 RepID=A0A1D3TUH2_9FIRM|nr:sensor histidine kinase [Anaerobium acetethylicum]SCP97689.1 Sensor histidine kinase YesM [Anaerobium acetethylicum]
MNSFPLSSLLIYFPLELFGAVIVYGFLLKRRTHFAARMIIFALLSYFAVVQLLSGVWEIAGIADLTSYKTSFMMYGLLCVCIFLSMIVVVWGTCDVRFREAVYCATCAYLTEHMVYCIRILINHVSGKNLTDAGTIWYYLVHAGAYFIAYHIFVKRMISGKHYAAGAVQSLWLSLSTLFMVLVMSLVASAYEFAWIHGIYAFFCCFFVLISQVNQLKQLNLQNELNYNQQLWIKHKAQYDMSKENIDIINRKCHDLKHQVAALRQISDLEKQKEAIDSMEHSILIYDSILETGNEILDTVLTEKSLICTANNIDLNCMIDGKRLDFMDTVDLYTLFGNALDNAIEGVLKLDREENCGISILVHEKVNLIFIQVENHFRGGLQMKNGLPLTDKEDKKYHGFGLKSIIHVAEKYGGFVKIETDCQIFVLRITIPIYEKALTVQ